MALARHTVTSFDDELTRLQARISEMGGIAEHMLSGALDAIAKRDLSQAEDVVRRDHKLDKLEHEVEEDATRLIALRQPVAQDLRLLISALKICTTLERIGDLSKNIAKRAMAMNNAGKAPMQATPSIVRMGRAALSQLSDVLNAYASRDTETAIAVWQRDIDIDEMYNALFREVLTYMMEDNKAISAGSQMLFIAKNLERIGDHTTHISEMIYYTQTGEPLADDRPKGEPMGMDLG